MRRRLTRASRVRHERRGDAGLTLMDLLVSMSIMTVVMGIFAAGVTQMYQISNGTEALSTAQSQISQALLRLDKEVRYASSVSRPYDGGMYVDFLTVRPGVSQCVQLRVANNQLQQRTWTYKASPLVMTAWLPLASGVTSTTPFAYIPPDANGIGFQRLTVSLSTVSGGAAGRAGKASTITYTALNTTKASGNDLCNAGRSTP